MVSAEFDPMMVMTPTPSVPTAGGGTGLVVVEDTAAVVSMDAGGSPPSDPSVECNALYINAFISSGLVANTKPLEQLLGPELGQREK